jgi:TonB family protein
VDLGPYLDDVWKKISANWVNSNVARAALLEKGKVSVDFAITTDGSVAGIHLKNSSDLSENGIPLERAAWDAITAADPLPRLPNDFNGQYLGLRLDFYYNPVFETGDAVDDIKRIYRKEKGTKDDIARTYLINTEADLTL